MIFTLKHHSPSNELTCQVQNLTGFSITSGSLGLSSEGLGFSDEILDLVVILRAQVCEGI